MTITKQDFLNWFDDPKAAESFMVGLMGRVKEMWRNALREDDVHRAATVVTAQMTMFSQEIQAYFEAHYQTDLDHFSDIDAEAVDLMKSMRVRQVEILPLQVMSAVYQKSINELLVEDALNAPKLQRLSDRVIRSIELYMPAIAEIVDGPDKGRKQ